jgi:hypothetical protein
MICSSNGHVLEKPREAQYLTHATFVPNNSSQGKIQLFDLFLLNLFD